MMRSSSAQPSSKNPLVSIGLPTRNRAHLLKEALESLLGQTYRNIEYIVSDNASTDGTAELLHDYAARDPRIRYIRQDTDINGMENHEFVLRKAQGEYFMWASDDDWWHPRFVETLVDVLEKNPSYGVAMSYYYKHFINRGEAFTKEVRHNFTPLTHQQLYRKYLRGRATPIFFFGLYRTRILRQIFIRKTPRWFNGLLLTFCEVALATRSYSVPEFLHRQLQDTRLHIVRHPTNPYTIGELKPFAVTHAMLMVPWWLFTSPAITLRRKHLIFGPWLWRSWLYKRKMAREIWRFVRYVILPFNDGKMNLDALLDEWLTVVNYSVLAHTLFLIKRCALKDRQAVLGYIRDRKQTFEKQTADPLSKDQITKLDFLEAQLHTP